MNKLAIWRGRRKLTLQELAQKSGVNKATIIRIEQGQRKPTPKTLGKLAEALDIDITELIENDGGEQSGEVENKLVA